MKRNTAALVTGASGGLGTAFARLCAEDGYDLVLSARNEEKLNRLKEELEQKYGIKAYVCPADLSKPDEALKILKYTEDHHLEIEILINNAGFGDAGAFAESDWNREASLVQVNVTALMQLCHGCLRQMISSGRGHILNVSSVAAFCAGPDMAGCYASKAFVRSFSEALYEETKGTGVTVTALCPGPTATGFEKAAGGGRLHMFDHAADPASVAQAGYKAMKQGKALCYPGMIPKLMNLGSRISPRSVSRAIAKKMNH